MAGRRQFGYIEKLPSGRYRAMYHFGMGHQRVKAPTTFRTKAEAGAWLAREQVRIEAGAAGSPRAVKPRRRGWVTTRSDGSGIARYVLRRG